MTLVFIWTIITFFIASTSILIGKRYGVEYPIAVFACLAALANVLAVKFVLIGDHLVAAGIIVFMATYLISDLISEIWGKRYAKKAVWAGLFVNIFFAISIYIAVIWPGPVFGVEFSAMFAEVMSGSWRIIFASMVAYIISMHLDVVLFHKIKEATSGRYLWLRNNTASLFANTVGVIIFTTIAFYGVIDDLATLIITAAVIQSIMILVDTPIAYVIRYWASKISQK